MNSFMLNTTNEFTMDESLINCTQNFGQFFVDILQATDYPPALIPSAVTLDSLFEDDANFREWFTHSFSTSSVVTKAEMEAYEIYKDVPDEEVTRVIEQSFGYQGENISITDSSLAFAKDRLEEYRAKYDALKFTQEFLESEIKKKERNATAFNHLVKEMDKDIKEESQQREISINKLMKSHNELLELSKKFLLSISFDVVEESGTSTLRELEKFQEIALKLKTELDSCMSKYIVESQEDEVKLCALLTQQSRTGQIYINLLNEKQNPVLEKLFGFVKEFDSYRRIVEMTLIVKMDNVTMVCGILSAALNKMDSICNLFVDGDPSSVSKSSFDLTKAITEWSAVLRDSNEDSVIILEDLASAFHQLDTELDLTKEAIRRNMSNFNESIIKRVCGMRKAINEIDSFINLTFEEDIPAINKMYQNVKMMENKIQELYLELNKKDNTHEVELKNNVFQALTDFNSFVARKKRMEEEVNLLVKAVHQ